MFDRVLNTPLNHPCQSNSHLLRTKQQREIFSVLFLKQEYFFFLYQRGIIASVSRALTPGHRTWIEQILDAQKTCRTSFLAFYVPLIYDLFPGGPRSLKTVTGKIIEVITLAANFNCIKLNNVCITVK